jgi:hypothetical protein
MLEQRETQPAEQRALPRQLRTHFLEYGRLGLLLAKLYFEGRMLMAQNFILSCRLRMWDAVFIYFKIQIFFVRLSYGFPINECWPAEKSCRRQPD